MTKPPAWQVDPAWPAVPRCQEDEDNALGRSGTERESLDFSSQRDLIADERAVLRKRVAQLHVESVRLQFKLHHAQRALQAQPPEPAPEAQPHRRRGHPGHRGRNDRLLALYQTTPAHLPHLQRCRLAAHRYAEEVASAAGLKLEHARVLPATTARDAIAEAQARRDRSRSI